MNLRRGFDVILRRYGHNVYLQRLCGTCEPSGAYQQPDQNCTECRGTGYSRTLERHTCRKMLNRKGSGETGGVALEPEGIIPNAPWAFYFRHDVSPEQGDRIYDDNKVYRINEIYDPRGPHGRVEYYICYAKRVEGKEYG